ncbi:MAG: hypothetical protein GQ531_05620 [Sulfurovum sp.]|nr:hypothetical protein [Sulfurovum sp.]
MGLRKSGTRNTLKFSAEEVTLAVDMLASLEKTIDMVYYLMERENVGTFVLMLLKAENADMGTILEKEKRDTDILFEINKEKSTYVMLCQDTKVDGGYRFAERVIESIAAGKGTDIYCSQVEVRTTKHPVKTVLFTLLEIFLKAQRETKTSEIVYKSLN